MKSLLPLLCLSLASAHAQPTIVSTLPPNLATGVSPGSSVVFVFSEPMNPGATSAQFMDAMSFPPAFLPVSSVWSAGNTMLTCTPVSSWPANRMIVWLVEGENPAGDPLDGETAGTFTTGNSGNGDCTNEVGALTLGKGVLYRQTSPGDPSLETNVPFVFVACTTVACSNWTTTNISLTVPGGAMTNLLTTLIPGHYSLSGFAASPAGLDADYPNGNYVFTLRASAGNVPCAVNFPSSLAWPNAPHLTNFAAARSVDPTQPFVLGWDAFQGASAQDCVYVEIYGGAFQTPAPGTPGVLPGTARSVTIPADTFQPNRVYDGAVAFYDQVLTTNASGYVSLVYRSATTEFSLQTSSGEPALAVSRTPTNTAVISWPLRSGAWRLQFAASVTAAPSGWTEVPPPYKTNAGACSCVVPMSVGNRFYRLYEP